MQSNKTIIGLMMFLFQSAHGNISITLMSCSMIGIVFLVTGISGFHTFFILMTVLMPPYSIITSIAGGYVSKYSSKWERFQIAMPVRRKDVTLSQYLCIIIASIVGIPFIVIITGITIAMHESLLEIVNRVVSSTVSIFSISIGIVLLLGALFFPLTCMKISKNRGESLAFVCLFVAMGMIGLVSWVGFSMNLSQYTISLLRITVSIIPFIFSYLITQNLYAKLDLC
jgi:hypothetical protein